ncbi:hypothetical protein X777_02026 [Ooceraea biroi]|nr:hypothetical protein X777_02026 [Ooceraea biroi]
MLTFGSEEKASCSYFSADLYDKCEEAYFSAKTELLTLKDNYPDPAELAVNTSLNASTTNNTRALPKITLPKFSGEYQEWRTFHDLFTSMVVDNPHLAAVEKLHYLKSHITGEAA